MRTVHIIDCHYLHDCFADRADGPITQQFLKTLNIRAGTSASRWTESIFVKL